MHQQQDQVETHETILERFQELLWEKDFEFSELLSGLAASLWGLWLLNPLWSSFQSAPAFDAMAQLANEVVWGGMMAGLGVLQLSALILNRWRLRRSSAFLLCCVWMFIAVMLARANFRGTGTVIYPLLSLSAGWAYVRMRQERL